MIHFTKEEKDFILDLFDKVQVKITDPGAVRICVLVEEINKKMKEIE